MFNPLLLSLVFGLGVFIESYLLLRRKVTLKKVSFVFLISFGAFFPGKNEVGYDLYSHVFTYFLFFSLGFTCYFYKEILPVVSEQILLQYTLIFWYVYFIYFYKLPTIGAVLGIVGLSSLVLMIVTIIKSKRLANFYKFLLYVWYLFMVVILSLCQFSFGNLKFFFDRKEVPSGSLLETFLTGMAFVYLVGFISYIILLIPIPGKHQSFKERIKELRKYVGLLITKYSDYQMTVKTVFTMFLIQGGSLVLNFHFQIVPHFLLVNFWIVVIPLVLSFYYKVKTHVL